MVKVTTVMIDDCINQEDHYNGYNLDNDDSNNENDLLKIRMK